jgi:hypothetical protein
MYQYWYIASTMLTLCSEAQMSRARLAPALLRAHRRGNQNTI